MKRFLVFLSLYVVFTSHCFGQKPETPAPQNLTELSKSVNAIGKQFDVPGASISILLPSGDEWHHQYGFADIDEELPITKQSQFRWGSVSKMLVSLSVLKLVENGVLSLDDKIAEIAPLIAFRNPWEDTSPLQIKHLLAHTTGWDAPHFVEQVAQSDKPINLLDALNIHPHSRVSRWPPGTRIAYNNTGFLVAAYIVEQVSSLTYEQFVRETFFTPLNMNKASYFYSDNYRNSAAKLYKNKRAVDYWHLNNRAAGGLNSSTQEMLNLVGFLTRNTRFYDPTVLSIESLITFEKPLGSAQADAGIELTWSLGNQIFRTNGQTMYGHEGSLPGANAILVYSPQHQFGYVIASNTNSPFVTKTHQLISQFLTRNIAAPKTTHERSISPDEVSLSGFYRNLSPTSELTSAFTTLLPWRLSITPESASIKPLFGGAPRNLIAAKGGGYKQDTSGKIALMFSNDRLAGSVLLYGTQTLIKTSAISAYLPIITIVLWVLIAILGVFSAFVWLPKLIFGKIDNRSSISLRVWPLVTFLILVVTGILIRHIAMSSQPFEIAGKLSMITMTIFILSIGYLLANLWSVRVFASVAKIEMSRYVKWHSALFIALNLILCLYLLFNGLIGVQLWA